MKQITKKSPLFLLMLGILLLLGGVLLLFLQTNAPNLLQSALPTQGLQNESLVSKVLLKTNDTQSAFNTALDKLENDKKQISEKLVMLEKQKERLNTLLSVLGAPISTIGTGATLLSQEYILGRLEAKLDDPSYYFYQKPLSIEIKNGSFESATAPDLTGWSTQYCGDGALGTKEYIGLDNSTKMIAALFRGGKNSSTPCMYQYNTSPLELGHTYIAIADMKANTNPVKAKLRILHNPNSYDVQEDTWSNEITLVNQTNSDITSKMSQLQSMLRDVNAIVCDGSQRTTTTAINDCQNSKNSKITSISTELKELEAKLQVDQSKVWTKVITKPLVIKQKNVSDGKNSLGIWITVDAPEKELLVDNVRIIDCTLNNASLLCRLAGVQELPTFANNSFEEYPTNGTLEQDNFQWKNNYCGKHVQMSIAGDYGYSSKTALQLSGSSEGEGCVWQYTSSKLVMGHEYAISAKVRSSGATYPYGYKYPKVQLRMLRNIAKDGSSLEDESYSDVVETTDLWQEVKTKRLKITKDNLAEKSLGVWIIVKEPGNALLVDDVLVHDCTLQPEVSACTTTQTVSNSIGTVQNTQNASSTQLPTPQQGTSLKESVSDVTSEFIPEAFRLYLLGTAQTPDDSNKFRQSGIGELKNHYDADLHYQYVDFKKEVLPAYQEAQRDLIAGYDEDAYVLANPDVYDGLRKQTIPSGYKHYIQIGKKQERLKKAEYNYAVYYKASMEALRREQEGFQAEAYRQLLLKDAKDYPNDLERIKKMSYEELKSDYRFFQTSSMVNFYYGMHLNYIKSIITFYSLLGSNQTQ